MLYNDYLSYYGICIGFMLFFSVIASFFDERITKKFKSRVFKGVFTFLAQKKEKNRIDFVEYNNKHKDVLFFQSILTESLTENFSYFIQYCDRFVKKTRGGNTLFFLSV